MEILNGLEQGLFQIVVCLPGNSVQVPFLLLFFFTEHGFSCFLKSDFILYL